MTRGYGKVQYVGAMTWGKLIRRTMIFKGTTTIKRCLFSLSSSSGKHEKRYNAHWPFAASFLWRNVITFKLRWLIVKLRIASNNCSLVPISGLELYTPPRVRGMDVDFVKLSIARKSLSMYWDCTMVSKESHRGLRSM